MTEADPIDLLFGGMAKLGPGSDADTVHVLGLLPQQRLRVVVDAGCGSGRQTLVLARSLGVTVDAVDAHQPFLTDLVRRATEAGIDHLVRTHCMDMKNIADVFSGVDLLWSEGAAYSIGFANALATWAPAVTPGGFVVVSELSWLSDRAPEAVRQFCATGYPAMQPVTQNIATCAGAGYRVLATHVVPRQAWVEGYYDVLGPRARGLIEHPDASVRAFAAETIHEIETFEFSADSYGYVFYVLERA